ncbi:hypothetical protein POM88_006560 [Heracleum sosnowskyi]|uniref:Uncharacterized protein n=1 Tax=Heracleum sosnowskyi TaxID=360622 RepID=A0AAD8J2T9_9APIA|nr:hypothetical protein POM88_006560 [Heracleum sosnowskyi]
MNYNAIVIQPQWDKVPTDIAQFTQTVAETTRIGGGNSNREISNLGIEKLLYKNNDKWLSYNRDAVSKKSVKFEVDDTENLSGIKKPRVPIQNAVDNTDDNDELRRSPGTPVFTAPECCLGLTYGGKAADT